jgi:hypothetical protein
MFGWIFEMFLHRKFDGFLVRFLGGLRKMACGARQLHRFSPGNMDRDDDTETKCTGGQLSGSGVISGQTQWALDSRRSFERLRRYFDCFGTMPTF